MAGEPIEEIYWARNSYNSAVRAHQDSGTRRTEKNVRDAEKRLKTLMFEHRDDIADLCKPLRSKP